MKDSGDDLNDIDDAVESFDSDTVDVDALLARLGRLQKLLAEREENYAAAVRAYNTALRAAYDQFCLTANEYQRASETVSQICSAITFEMHRLDEEKEEASPGWDRSKEARQLRRWLEIWEVFETAVSQEHVASVPVLEPRKKPLSQMIAALPRRPEELELPEIGRRIAPKIADSVKQSWKRIDAWLAENSPALARKMNPGATPEAISRAESSLGVELPDAVRASYLVHDGSRVISLFPPGYYSTLEEMTEHGLMMRKILEDGGFEGNEDEFVGVGPFQRAYYHPSWIPVTNNSGCFTFIDLAPEQGGVVGQLINFLRDDGPQDIAAPGLAEYLSYLADGLEAGAATIEEDSYLVWNEGEVTSRSGYALPATATATPPVNAPAGEAGRRYFEFKEGSSSKFWEITHEGEEVTTRYGKIGAHGSSTTKSFDTAEKAAAEAAKIIAKKVKEGYVEKTS